MNLFEAQHLARTLMREHGLSTDWSFRFDRARRRFGSCRVREKLITLSRALTFMNSQAEVRDTILHEIAHALTPGDGHGRPWKAKCRELGAKPVRCYGDESVVSPPRRPAAYIMGCQSCDWWVDRRRRTRRKLVCKTCRSPVLIRAKAS